MEVIAVLSGVLYFYYLKCMLQSTKLSYLTAMHWLHAFVHGSKTTVTSLYQMHNQTVLRMSLCNVHLVPEFVYLVCNKCECC